MRGCATGRTIHVHVRSRWKRAVEAGALENSRQRVVQAQQVMRQLVDSFLQLDIAIFSAALRLGAQPVP
jgi:hypothetical protein